MPYTLADIRPVSLLLTLIGHDNNIPTMQLLAESKSYTVVVRQNINSTLSHIWSTRIWWCGVMKLAHTTI